MDHYLCIKPNTLHQVLRDHVRHLSLCVGGVVSECGVCVCACVRACVRGVYVQYVRDVITDRARHALDMSTWTAVPPHISSSPTVSR